MPNIQTVLSFCNIFFLWKWRKAPQTVNEKVFKLKGDSFGHLDELVLSLCRNDQEEELEKLVLEDCDVNFVDGAGNTGAHYA